MADPQLPDPLVPPPDMPDPPPARRAGPAAQWYAEGNRAKASGKGTALVVTVLLFVAVAGVLAAMFAIPRAPVDPHIISIPVVEYKDTAVPPNPWAERDAELLCACFPADAENTRKNAQARSPFRQKLDDVRRLAERWAADPGKPQPFDPKRPLVLHVCAHAATAGGTLYLLPSDAAAGDPTTWVKVEDVLRAMDECPSTNKLLILDLARPTADAFTGPLSDDAAARLEDLLAKYKAPDGADRLPCPVLTACSRGEVSLVIPEARVSAFAFYLAEGLRGEADGYEPGRTGERRKDQRVYLSELAEFLPARVQRWALQNYGVTQTPKLHTRGVESVDFPVRLKQAPADDPAPGKLEYAGFDGPGRWQQRDKVPPPARTAAGAELARWEAVLVRADRVYAATADPRSANDPIAAGDRLWQRAQEAARPAAPGGYRSWSASAPALAANPLPDPVKQLLAVRTDYLQAMTQEGGKPEDRDRAVAERRAKFKEAAAGQPELAALAVWRWLLDATAPGGRDVPRRPYEAAVKAIRDALGTSDALYTEAVLIQAIDRAEDNSRAFRDPRAAPAKAALLRTEEAAAAALLAGPDGFLWARDLVDDADRDKQAEERKLFGPNPPPANAYTGVAERLADAARRFDEARKRMQAVGEARAAAGEALRVLSATATAAAETDDQGLEADWFALADATLPLVGLVYQPPRPAGEVPTTQFAAADRVAGPTAKLRERWSPAEVKRRTEPGPSEPKNLRPLALDLAVPLLAADDRKRVWDAAYQAGATFHQKTRAEQDKPENESNARTKPAVTPAAGPGDPARRARVSLKLLELAGYADSAAAARAVDTARAAGTPEAWEQAADALRRAWTEKLPKQAAADAARGEWERAERAGRAFPAGLWPDVARAAVGAIPAVARREAEAAAFRDWLRGHYGAYGKIRKDVPGAEGSYDKAAAGLGPPSAN